MVDRKLAVAVVLAILILTGALVAAGGDKKTKLKKSLGDPEPSADWIYDDFWGAVAVAKRTGKPLLTVFR
ncbi:MAG: hypothetical protein ACYS47_17615 [Planctomycetota bacterium]